MRISDWSSDVCSSDLLLSTASNDYSHHYFGDTSKFGAEMRDARGYEPGENWDEPMYNVFRKDADGTVRHFWGSELLYVQEEPGQDHRAGALVDPDRKNPRLTSSH